MKEKSWPNGSRVGLVIQKVLGPAGIVGGGVNVQRSLHLQYRD